MERPNLKRPDAKMAELKKLHLKHQKQEWPNTKKAKVGKDQISTRPNFRKAEQRNTKCQKGQI